MRKGAMAAMLLLLVLSVAAQQNATKRTFQGSVTIKLGTFEDFFLRVVTAEPVIHIKPGETKSFSMFVRRGDSPKPVHNVSIVDADPVFELATEPATIPIIRNVDMARVTAELTVPPETEPGTYPLLIKVKGEEFVEEHYPIDTKIRVGRSNAWARYLFLALAAGCIGFLIWRKRHIE